MLEIDNISKSYRGIEAVSAVSFAVAPGEIVGFLGPNGAGKSTTVKIATGMLEPTSGEVRFRGRPIASDLQSFRAVLGYVPEEAHLYTHLSGLEYLQLAGRLRGMSEAVILARATTLLEQLGLASWRHSPISLYSKGMKQRVLIAAAILHDPALVVLDEPLSGLDVTTARLFRDLLVELAAEGKAILYISHVLEVVEKVCDRVVVLANGRIRAIGPPAELCAVLGLPDLPSVFAHLVMEMDTKAAARRMVEAIRAA
jgi:ABC-2 type transport system ATP-binding protein